MSGHSAGVKTGTHKHKHEHPHDGHKTIAANGMKQYKNASNFFNSAIFKLFHFVIYLDLTCGLLVGARPFNTYCDDDDYDEKKRMVKLQNFCQWKKYVHILLMAIN